MKATTRIIGYLMAGWFWITLPSGRRPRAGELVSRFFRVARYMTLISLPAALLTFVKVYGYRWWAVLVFTPLFFLAWWIDPRIQQGEMDYSNQNNEEWQKHRADIAEILRLLREKK